MLILISCSYDFSLPIFVFVVYVHFISIYGKIMNKDVYFPALQIPQQIVEPV